VSDSQLTQVKVLKRVLGSLAALVLVVSLAQVVSAATAIGLGTASSFAVLAGSTLTNTGSSVINGNLGLHPGTSVTGFPPGTINGSQEVASAAALQAQTDLVTAYNNASGQAMTATVPAELGGTIKTAGVYDSATGAFAVTGALTLDAQGNSGAIFIFRAASTLTTAGSSSVVLTNGAQACNVFWQVGSSATLGTNSTFKGNILALTSVTLTTGAQVNGRVLARNGAVTLDSNTITTPTCAAASTPTPTPASTPTPSVSPAATPTPVPTPSAIFTPTPTISVTPSSSVMPSSTLVPSLPNTGVTPDKKNGSSILLMLSGLVAVSLIVLVAAKQKTS
jgi:hypothetical protein